jgi:hypothetical protein
LVAGHVLLLLPSPAWLVYLKFYERFPSPPLQCSGHPTLFATCLFFLLLLIIWFLFFPWVGVVLSRGLCWSGPGLSVGVCVLLSSPCGLRLPKPSGCCHLAAAWGPFWFFLFTVKWGCYAQAGGVEQSKFCLFLVVFPVRCISSVSPRVYFRRHAFCFLPLAAILEFSPSWFFQRFTFLNLVLNPGWRIWFLWSKWDCSSVSLLINSKYNTKYIISDCPKYSKTSSDYQD